MPAQMLQQAITLIKAGETEPARKLLAQVLKVDPDHEQAWYWIANCFKEQERKQYCYERVLKTNPQNPEARKALADLWISASQVAEADQLIALTPPSAAAQPGTTLQAAPEDTPKADTGTSPEEEPSNEKTPLADIKHLGTRLEGHRFSGILSFLLSLLIVAMFAAAVIAGLNYLLPDDIPVSHADLKSHFTKIGIFCSSVEPADRATGYAYVMRCNGYPGSGRVQVSADIYSERDAAKTDLILAYATQLQGEPSTSEMGDLLAHVAALPYQNASPGLANAWVLQNFPNLLSGQTIENPETQFGRVRFHLAKLNSSKMYLAIGKGQN